MTRGNGDKGSEPGSPRSLPGKESLRPQLPRRFYKTARVEAATVPDDDQQVDPASAISYCILLDDRPVRTPKKRQLAVPEKALANAIAAEWSRQGERIDPATMPLTRIANTAIDAVADAMEDVREDIVAFAGSDLLCYRAEGPPELASRQAQHWDPVLNWVREALGIRLILGQGIMPVDQGTADMAALSAKLKDYDALALSALHVVTTLTGSALLALALAHGHVGATEAWAAAHVDEDYQIEQWGPDEEAEARRRTRKIEFEAAVEMLHVLEMGALKAPK